MKIKNKILTKLTNLTECEWKLFEYMIRRQDNSGKVFGVHNKAVCQTTKMSKQSFYNALRGLAEKKVITYEAGVPEYTVNPVAKHKIFGRSIDYNVTITDNDFPMKEQKEKAMYPCSVNYSEARICFVES